MNTKVSLPQIILVFFIIIISFITKLQYDKVENYIETVGTVVSVNEVKEYSSTERRYITKCYPTITYSIDGIEYSFTSEGNTKPHSIKEGEKVKIIYNPQNPSDALVKPNLLVWYFLLGLSFIIFMLHSLYSGAIDVRVFSHNNKNIEDIERGDRRNDYTTW